MRRIRFLLLLAPLLFAQPVCSHAAEATDAAEALYRQRLAALMGGAAPESIYQPLEDVPGVPASTALPRAPSVRSGTHPSIIGGIRAGALAAAEAYAADSKASAFLVWHQGELVAERYFDGVTATTPLPSKSLSKPLAAVAVGRAIFLGYIRSLDQPVADFIPEWRGTPKAAILVRHLLDMRSGLLDQGVSADPDSPWNRAYLSPDHGRYIVADYPMTDAPGTRFAYSNATADLVALVVERATGRRYAEFLGHEVLSPIGSPGGVIWVSQAAGLAHSGCCILLPAESWLRLARLLLEDGVADGRRILPPFYVRGMVTPTAENPRYGLGVWVAGPYVERRGFGAPGAPGPSVRHGEPYLDRDLYLFDGNGNQTVHVSPATGLIVLRMGPTPPKSLDWDNARLPNLLLRGLVAPPPLAPQPIP
ncbi:serine hydrolase domain-containing protein [Nitrospirillum iridis]|uniref:CubicO group peptidase (Beta-lactamase class C family) n=1 Tax=Nitrospirillum iridis TaxID=765888 RepID=A0A7X0EFJ6_9PROT|nr:serine hydrolase domain-containing protein [Nitrospirillum iridis]MBB6253111.1 CubicO group peptidase (beta-lactamase class C family) [Nitrospirillum iridis]